MIDNHSPRKNMVVNNGNTQKGGYGDLGLNKKVNTTKPGINISLDDFLESDNENNSDFKLKENQKSEIKKVDEEE